MVNLFKSLANGKHYKGQQAPSIFVPCNNDYFLVLFYQLYICKPIYFSSHLQTFRTKCKWCQGIIIFVWFPMSFFSFPSTIHPSIHQILVYITLGTFPKWVTFYSPSNVNAISLLNFCETLLKTWSTSLWVCPTNKKLILTWIIKKKTNIKVSKELTREENHSCILLLFLQGCDWHFAKNPENAWNWLKYSLNRLEISKMTEF